MSGPGPSPFVPGPATGLSELQYHMDSLQHHHQQIPVGPTVVLCAFRSDPHPVGMMEMHLPCTTRFITTSTLAWMTTTYTTTPPNPHQHYLDCYRRLIGLKSPLFPY